VAQSQVDTPGRPRLLLVEDELILARVLEIVFIDAGYDVTTCFDGAVALEAFDGSPEAWDVVLSDVAMPRLAGDELARTLRERRPRLPIVLMSGNTMAVAPRELLTLGVTAVVEKPCAMEVLLEAVNAACERPQA
jgi:DNA-binding response OmpR family regulator